MFHSVFVTMAVKRTNSPFFCRALCSLAQVSFSIVTACHALPGCWRAGFSVPRAAPWACFQEGTAPQWMALSGWCRAPRCHQCQSGVSSAFSSASSADVPSWFIPMASQMNRTLRSQKQIWQVNWELCWENCRELNVGWLQPSRGSCCPFHTCSW